MNSCKKVLVTGGIGSGKSTVCSLLKTAGVPVYDSDSATKELYHRAPGLVERLEREIGVVLRGEDDRFDGRRLAAAIFSDETKLKKVESIVHPLVLEDFRMWQEGWERRLSIHKTDREMPGWKFVVMESAVAMEKPCFRNFFDAVVLVDAPMELRLERACGRDGAGKEMILRRMAGQHFDTFRVDAVIVNDSDLESLKYRTKQVFTSIVTNLGW